MLLGRLDQIRNCSFKGMEGTQDINIHHGLECINGELVNGREEIARCPSTGELVSTIKKQR